MDDKQTTISAKLPMETYRELALRIPEGERSTFIRDAITEKLDKTPRPDKIEQFEQKMNKIETELASIRKLLTELELTTFEKDKVNPHIFCIDETDHKVVDYLLNYEGATTPELAEQLKTNRWQMLNRLRRIQNRSKKQLGKPIIEYYAGERNGKKKAWWINRELNQET